MRLQELPRLDVTLRGAASIARRLQDPLAELVKIDPKSIGVGQYQHDLSEQKLGRSLDAVVEDCVNAVGVDVNTASAKLLARVSGVGEALAQAIVVHRESARAVPQSRRAEGGAAPRRKSLRTQRRVPADQRRRSAARPLGRASGSLSGRAPHPRPARGRHPRRHRQLARAPRAKTLPTSPTTRFGVPTVADILKELEKPGRDPRPAFRTATFREGVESLSDLKPGMVLEGVVTNVAAFGAFVDVGVHQDGLVHVSAMANSFVKDPRAVAKPGDVVKVKVLSVDVPRKRISLTMRLSDPEGAVEGARPGRGDAKAMRAVNAEANRADPGGGALADALKRAAEKGTRRSP